MDNLRQRVHELIKLTNRQDIIKALQNLEKYLLSNYQMRVSGHIVQLKEIEIYYKHKGVGFVDTTMHGRDRQKDNFNNLYLHGAGIDVCLSDSKEYFLSILIRGGVVDGNIELRTHRPILLYDVVKPPKVSPTPVLEPLAEPSNDDVYYAVRYGVQKMTVVNNVPVKQEDKELVLRAYIGTPGNEVPGKTSFTLL